jgi:hypothetical protein
MDEVTETKMSTFNEAAHQMGRINELQLSMNHFRINPFDPMRTTSEWGFQHWSSCLDGLYLEVSAKLKPEEDKEVMDLLKISKNNMSELLKYDSTLWGCKVHRLKMTKIRGSLFNAEKKIRRLLDLHGLSSPNAENNPGDPYS